MRAFLKKAGLFFLLQVVVLGLFLARYRVDKTAYLGTIREKHARLQSAPDPRLLLLGGSNVAFGTDGARLHDALAVEPVNLGLQGSLGLRFFLNDAEKSVRAGDIVVVSPEYQQYLARCEEPLTIFGLLEQEPSDASSFDLDWFLTKALFDRGHTWFRGVVRSDVNGLLHGPVLAARPYTRDSLDEYGDTVAHWSMPAPGFTPSKVPADPSLEPGVLAALNRFGESCVRRGARVFLFHPAYSATEHDASHTALIAIQDALDKHCSIEQLNRVDEMRYPDDVFYDSPYHLTRPAVVKRTDLLISRLQTALSK